MNHFQKYYIVYFLSLFAIILPDKNFAQREVIVKRSIVINCPNPAYALEVCTYGLLVPANRPGRQEIVSYTYPSIKPHHFNKTDGNEYYLMWKDIAFNEFKKGELDVNVKIKLYKYDLKTAKKHPIKDTSDIDTTLYLKNEENFRIKSKTIKEAAATITGNEREEIVKNIFYYVDNSLDYHIFMNQDRGAKKALKEGRGDCTEYSELMVTLCRAKQIPARIVMGLIPKSSSQVGHHNWVEVYFPQYGWVAFDPTWADHPKATTTFSTMKNTYVQLSNKRFINSIICPCYNGSEIFTIKLKDTCTDLSKNINIKIKEMTTYYNNMELIKANSLLDTLLTYENDNSSFWLFKGMTNARLGNFDEGYKCLQTAINNSESNHEKYSSLYALSNFYALKSDSINAVKYLKEAIDIGYSDYNHLLADTDYTKIRGYQPFIELQNALEEKNKEKLLKKQD